jgi:hypothetical protein
MWNNLTPEKQEEIASNNEHRSIEIYHENGKEVNPIPKNIHCIVYCHGSNTHGWVEISNPDELGLEAIIAQSWILISDLKS